MELLGVLGILLLGTAYAIWVGVNAARGKQWAQEVLKAVASMDGNCAYESWLTYDRWQRVGPQLPIDEAGWQELMERLEKFLASGRGWQSA